MYIIVYTALVATCGVAAGLLIGIVFDAYERRRAKFQKAADILYEGDVRGMKRYVSREAIVAAMAGDPARDLKENPKPER